jgi:hypothetical protein
MSFCGDIVFWYLVNALATNRNSKSRHFLFNNKKTTFEIYGKNILFKEYLKCLNRLYLYNKKRCLHKMTWDGWFGWFMVFNATFNNISVISWQLVLLEEETGVPGENHRPAASH